MMIIMMLVLPLVSSITPTGLSGLAAMASLRRARVAP